MITNLRERLAQTVAKKSEACEETCLVYRDVFSLRDFENLSQVTAKTISLLENDLKEVDFRKALFLDTETTGLHGAGTAAFLIGAGRFEEEGFVIYRFFMRDYAEESVLLRKFSKLLWESESVITYNGKSFDWPLLRDRFLMNGMREDWREIPQLDLLYAARRTWKERIGNCTLANLEQSVLHLEPRTDDIPGSQVPERYFQYLKTHNLEMVKEILHHNLLDVKTLVTLLIRLCMIYTDPREALPLDRLNIGRALERSGKREQARYCFSIGGIGTLHPRAQLSIAQSYRKDRKWPEAVEVYRNMIACGEGGMEPYNALALVQEWHMHDARGALDTVQKAMLRYGGTTLFDVEAQRTLENLEMRRRRLMRKIQKEQQ